MLTGKAKKDLILPVVNPSIWLIKATYDKNRIIHGMFETEQEAIEYKNGCVNMVIEKFSKKNKGKRNI